MIFHSKIYEPKDIDFVLSKIPFTKTIRNNKKIEYYNFPISFDIETSSFKKFSQLNNEEIKIAVMYVWQLTFCEYTIVGRTWDEFKYVYAKLVAKFKTDENRRLVIFVHNLSYEFQFIRKHFKWFRVFALENRKPVQCVTVDGIEFRCSYILSGFSLEKLAENLTKHKIEKLKGYLNYKELRLSKTPLTEKELEYCTNDTKIVVAYISELLERDGNITKLPLTKTGYVRNYCRERCFMKPPVKNRQISLKNIAI